MKMIKELLQKYNKLPVILKASVVYLIMSLVQKGLGFITAPVFVRLMSSEEYGTMSIYFTNEQLLGTVAMFCLAYGCFDVGMQDYKHDRYKFMFSILVLSNVITVITGMIIFALFPFIGDYMKISKYLLLIMFIGFLFSPAFVFWTREERYIYKYKSPAVLTIASAVLSSILSIICVYYFNDFKVETRITSALVAMCPLYLFFWFYIARKAKFSINFQYIKFAVLFNFPLIPHYLSSFVLNSSDRLMIANMVGESQAAYYSLAYNLAAIVAIIWSAINSSLVPYVFDKYEKKDFKTVSNHVLPILSLFAVMCLMIVLMAPEVIKILGTAEYYEAIYIIPPVVGGIFFEALYYLFTNILYYYKRPKIVMYASISAAALNIVLNYVFIKIFGYIAAGYTTLICFLLQAILDYIVAKKIVGQDIYDMKYLVVLSVIVLVISIISNILYSFTLLRWIIIAMLLVFLFVKRKIILNMRK